MHFDQPEHILHTCETKARMDNTPNRASTLYDMIHNITPQTNRASGGGGHSAVVSGTYLVFRDR